MAKSQIYAILTLVNQRIGIIGASGWLGRTLADELERKGKAVTKFTRSKKQGWRQWDSSSVPDLSGLDAIVNLAGESVDQRWTADTKRRFRESRVDLTNFLVKGMLGSEVKTFLNASGVGYYGDRCDEILTEEMSAGSGYLAQLCVDWEAAALAATNTRVVLLRTGMVLGEGGRAWDKLSKVFKLGIGGRMGDGKQWMPWIHLQDEVNAIVHCLENEISGPLNLVAPDSVRNIEFTRALASVLKRPAFFPAPAFALRLALGEFADEALLASSRAEPRALLDSGFQFQYPHLAEALTELAS